MKRKKVSVVFRMRIGKCSTSDLGSMVYDKVSIEESCDEAVVADKNMMLVSS